MAVEGGRVVQRWRLHDCRRAQAPSSPASHRWLRRRPGARSQGQGLSLPKYAVSAACWRVAGAERELLRRNAVQILTQIEMLWVRYAGAQHRSWHKVIFRATTLIRMWSLLTPMDASERMVTGSIRWETVARAIFNQFGWRSCNRIGELGGIQVTGQQVTCKGSEILSASSMDNNILDGSNSEQVGSLDSNIIPNGNGVPTGIDLLQWLDILQNQTFDDSVVTETPPWGVSDNALDSTVCEAGNMLDSPFSEASISYVGHSPVSETGRGRSSLPLRGAASSRSYRGHSASPLRGAGAKSYRRHSASPLRVEGPRSYEGHNPSPVWGAGSTSYASADFTGEDILS